MASKKNTAVLQPNLGIYYDRARLAMSPRMLSDALNVRVKQGKISNLNLGWTRFGSFQLNGPVLLIQDFFTRAGNEFLIFATAKDIYKYVNDSTVVYLSPRYETGTVSRSGTTVTGVGTNFVTAGIKNGDQISFGTAGVVSTSATWDTITNVGGTTTLTTTGSGTVGSGPYTIRRLFQGNYTNVWQTAIFINASPSNHDELWLTNGLDSIVRWDGIATQVEVMTALNFTAKAITVYKNMMVFMNIVQGGTHKPSDMINSNPGEPQNVSSGLSEQFKVHGLVDEILRGKVLGDNLVIYAYTNEGVVTLTQFVGDPLVFVFRQVINGSGPLGPNAIADFGNYHEFIAPDSHYYFDGATVKSINTHIWREVLRQQDPARVSLTYTHFDLENGDLLWVVPLTSDPSSATTGIPSVAEVEHYLETPGQGVPTPWTRRAFPFFTAGYFKRQTGLTWDQLTDKWSNYNFRWNDRFFFASFPFNLSGDDVGKLYVFNTVQDANGAALGSFARFGRRPLFDGRIRGLLTRIYPFVTVFNTPLQVTAQMSDSGDGNILTNDTQNFDQTQPEGSHFTTHYRRGRFMEVQFSTNGPAQPWELSGYDYDVRPGGKR